MRTGTNAFLLAWLPCKNFVKNIAAAENVYIHHVCDKWVPCVCVCVLVGSTNQPFITWGLILVTALPLYFFI